MTSLPSRPAKLRLAALCLHIAVAVGGCGSSSSAPTGAAAAGTNVSPGSSSGGVFDASTSGASESGPVWGGGSESGYGTTLADAGTVPVLVYINGEGPTLNGGGAQSDATEDLVQGEFPSGTFAAADPSRLADLVERIDTALGEYGVDITTSRPPEGTDYMMLVVSAQPTPFHGFISLAGLDCENGNPNDVGLLFDDPADRPSSIRLARGAAYAIGLMLGVRPTEDPEDAMFPGLGEEPVNFVDACAPIATNIECEVEPRSCEGGQSNSHAELALALN